MYQRRCQGRRGHKLAVKVEGKFGKRTLRLYLDDSRSAAIRRGLRRRQGRALGRRNNLHLRRWSQARATTTLALRSGMRQAQERCTDACQQHHKLWAPPAHLSAFF